jgi:hypothetical protein
MMKMMMMMMMMMITFWATAPCILVEVNRRFRGVYCLHYQEDDGSSTHHYGAVSQQAVIFIVNFLPFIMMLLTKLLTTYVM